MNKITGNESVRLSHWTHVFFKRGTGFFALYHSLNIEVVFLENKFRGLLRLLQIGTTIDHLVKRLRLIPYKEIEGVCYEMSKIGIIVPIQYDDNLLLTQNQQKNVLLPGLETMYLIVTDECNLRCKYCFINNNMPKDYVCSTMSWEVAKEAVDMYFFNLSRNPPEYADFIKMIVFYGGEPLLNFSLIKHVIQYVEETYRVDLEKMNDTFRFSVVTNGTAITKEVAQFFGTHTNVDIAISLDGSKSIHNTKRVFSNGCGSFDCAIRGYQRLKKIGNRQNVAVSCTIDSHNLDRLPELLTLQEKYGFPAINLNPLLDTEQTHTTKKYMARVSKRMLEYFMLARKKGIYEDRIMRKANAFINKEIHSHDCQATGAQIVCSPDGRLGICHEGIGAKSFFFDVVSRNFRFHENPTVKEWKMRSPLNMPQCWNCSTIGICGGGCAYGAWLRNGSIWSVDDRFCIHSLETLKWFIWDLFERT